MEQLPDASLQSGVRRCSALLSTFPWATDFLSQDITTIADDSRFSTFVHAVTTLEGQLVRPDGLTADEAMRFADLTRIMAVVPPGQANLPSVRRINQRDGVELCSLLGTYRLLDVLYDLKNPTASNPNPRYPGFRHDGLRPTSTHWPLTDWRNQLKMANRSIQSMKAFKDGAPPPAPDAPVRLRLFKDLHQFWKQKVGAKILLNMQVAALHLSFMLSPQTKRLAIPNIMPESMSLDDITEEEQAFLREISSIDSHKLRHPLTAALLFSPLYLLSDKKLTQNAWSQSKMVELSKALGNTKPIEIVQVERALWRALLDVATGRSDLFTAVHSFMTNVDWDDLEMMDTNVLDYFANDPSKPLFTQLLSVEGETSLLASWPLSHARPRLEMSPAPQDAQMPREGEGSRSHDVSGERPRVGSPSSAEAVNPAEIVQAPGNDQDQVEVGAMLRMPSEPMMGFVMSPAPENSAGVDHTDEARAEDQVVVGAMLRMPSEHMMGFEMSPAPENTIWVDHADEARAEEISASDRELAEGSRAVTIRPAVDVRVLRRGPPPRSSDSGDAQTNRPVGFSLIRRPKPIKKEQGKRKASTRQPDKPLKFVPFQAVGDGTYLQPVHIPSFHADPIAFDTHQGRHRISGPAVVVITVSGEPREWTPFFHTQNDVDKFSAFYHLAEQCYRDGLPRYLSDPASSILQVIPFRQFLEMSIKEVQLTIRRRHILVTGDLARVIEFDEQGLQSLRTLSAGVRIRDQSTLKDGEATVAQVLEIAQNPHGPIIQASLPLPFHMAQIHMSHTSSDIEAWFLTEEGVQETHYPFSSMRWASGWTAGARSWIRIHPNGLGACLEVTCGGLLLLLFASPSDDSRSHFGSCHALLKTVNETDPAMLHVEPVYLTPGSRLFLRPNTPHIAVALDNTIIFGGFYYSFRNLRDTLSGLVHSFVYGESITSLNGPQPGDTSSLLFRMLQYLYKFFVQGTDPQKHRAGQLPDLDNSEDLCNVLALCIFAILSNVLDRRTYSFPEHMTQDDPMQLKRRLQFDYNALSPSDRKQFTFFRGLARNLIAWMNCSYTAVVVSEAVPIDIIGLASQSFRRQVAALLNYKARAVQMQVLGCCKLGDTLNQLKLLLDDPILDVNAAFLDRMDVALCADFCVDPSAYQVTKRSVPEQFTGSSNRLTEVDSTELGTTKGDKMFWRGTAVAFQLESSDGESEEEFSSQSASEAGSDSSMSL